MSNEATHAIAAEPAAPPAPKPAPLRRLLAPMAAVFDRYFTPLSAASLLAVAAILLVCIVLWDVEWLRPYLVAGGAGLAAFLGPIPGIISPDARTKWLATVVIAALIAIGTWVAARDLDQRLDQAAARDKFLLATLRDLPPNARFGLFSVAPRKLWALYHVDKDYATLRDMSLMLLAVDRENGHALYYAGEAYAKLDHRPEMVLMFQEFVAAAEAQPEASTGSAVACYSRPHGFCAERLGWISHRLADHYLTEALAQSDADMPKKLSDAFDYERRNLLLVKWRAEHHNPGFDEDKAAGARSSCAILMTVAREKIRLGLDALPVVTLGKEKLGDSCGRWPL